MSLNTLENTEEVDATQANFIFRMQFRNAVRKFTTGIPRIKVLDYGAGAVLLPYGPFGGLHNDQASVISYDPTVSPYVCTDQPELNLTQWVNREPQGQKFDLVGCNFSLHHMPESPGAVLRRFKQYRPSLVVIADYDYGSTTEDDFRLTFISQAERNELEEMFGGDVEACHRFHSRIGTHDYQQALVDNGFMVAHTETGIGIAKYKFVTIGVESDFV